MQTHSDLNSAIFTDSFAVSPVFPASGQLKILPQVKSALTSSQTIRLITRMRLFSSAILLTLPSVTAHAASGEKSQPEQGIMQVVARPVAGHEVTENTRSYTTDRMRSATGLPLSIRETPQSVSVITSQRMQDQNMRSLTDVMANTPGVSAYHYDMERYSFSSRGFSISSYQYDGIPTSYHPGYSAGEPSIDPIIYDRIEVVRGATGLLTGAGNPSASINLVRKHANSRDFLARLSAGAGSWDTWRVSADLSAPLSPSANVRGRLIAALEDGRSYIDRYTKRRQVIYGVIDADLSDTTSLSLGYNYQDNQPQGSSWGGFPLWYADGGRTHWPRSLNIGANWTAWGSNTQSGFISLKQYFATDWRVEASGSYSRYAMDGKLLFLPGWPDRQSGLGVRASPAWYLGAHKQHSADLKASGPVSLFGRDHEVVLGISVSRRNSSIDYRAPVTLPPVGNFLRWDGSYPEPDWASAVAENYDTVRQQGGYGVLRLSLADPLTLIAGGRYSRWQTDSAGRYQDHFSKTAFTPYAGLLYDFAGHYTGWISYSSIFNPQTSQDRHGNYLPPLQGKSWEAGIKASYLDDRLNASVSVFHTRQENSAEPDVGYQVPGSTSQAYYPAQGIRSQGIEMELTGEITPDWHLAVSYSGWNGQDHHGKPITTNQPRHLARGFTRYQLPGNWQNLSIGAGINWQSGTYTIAKGPAGKQRVGQGSYAVTSLMANYRVNRHFSAQLNIDNLFNRQYYNNIGFFSQGAWAAGRSMMLSLDYRF